MNDEQSVGRPRAEAQRRQALRDARIADRHPDPDARRCVSCGALVGLEKHHIYGRANSDECEWRCKGCHSRVTSSQYNMPAAVLAGGEKTPEQVKRAKFAHVLNDFERIYQEQGQVLDRLYEFEEEFE